MSDTIKVAGREFPFPTNSDERWRLGQQIGEALERGDPNRVEHEDCGCVTWFWPNNFHFEPCPKHRQPVRPDHGSHDDLFNLRLAMVEPKTFIGMLRESLGKALHVAGEIDGPVGRLASEEILRLVTRAAKIDRRLKALGKAVEK